MGIFQMIGSGFRVSLKSGLAIAILFAYGFVWNLVNIPFNQAQQASAGGSTATAFASVLLTILFLLTYVYMLSGLLSFIREALKKGKAQFADFHAGGTRHYWSMLGLGVILGLLMIILLIAASLAILAEGNEGLTAGSFAILAFLFVIGLVGFFLLFLSPYAIIAEDAKIISSIKISIAMIKKHFLKLAGTNLLLLLVIVGVWAVIGAVYAAVAGGARETAPGIGVQIAFGFISSLINAVWNTFVCGVFMSYYLSARLPAESAT